jgi:hypothetical protein
LNQAKISTLEELDAAKPIIAAVYEWRVTLAVQIGAGVPAGSYL